MTRPMKAPLSVGLIGLGRMGRVYAANLAHRVPNARLRAVADVNPDVAKAVAAQYDIQHCYGDHRDLIGDKQIDAVVVVTPTSTHGEVVIEAAKAVFCEKPISLSVWDFSGVSMLDSLKRRKRLMREQLALRFS